MALSKKQRDTLKDVGRQCSATLQVSQKKDVTTLQYLWPFQEFPIILRDDKYNDLNRFFRNHRVVPCLWGIQRRDDGLIELICPVQNTSEQDFEIDVAIKTYRGELRLTASSDSEILIHLYSAIKPIPFFFTPTHFDFLLNVNAQFVEDQAEESEDIESFELVVAQLHGYECPDGQNDLQQEMDFFKRIRFSMMYSAPAGPHIYVENESKHKLKESWFSDRPRKTTRECAGIQVHTYDPNLVDVYLAASQSSPRLAYILLYNLVEYLLDLRIDKDLTSRISRYLSLPDFPTRVDDLTLDILSEAKRDVKSTHESRVSSLISALYKPEEIARKIRAAKLDQNVTTFSGNLSLEPINVNNPKSHNIIDTVAKYLYRIRNGLVHYSEAGSGSILPTEDNEKLLLPWTSLLDDIAAWAIITFQER